MKVNAVAHTNFSVLISWTELFYLHKLYCAAAMHIDINILLLFQDARSAFSWDNPLDCMRQHNLSDETRRSQRDLCPRLTCKDMKLII
jgi:hypothetical protein